MSELQIMEPKTEVSTLEVFNRLIDAQNRRDLDGMVACFSRDYISEQPFHPERNFVGQNGVRSNWTHFFNTIPDIRMEVLSQSVDGDTIWSEVLTHGTRVDGKAHVTRGVILSRVKDGLIVWARLYIETPFTPVEGGVP